VENTNFMCFYMMINQVGIRSHNTSNKKLW
jgi:hypothetical protein